MVIYGMIVAIEKQIILLLDTPNQILTNGKVLGDLAFGNLEYFSQAKEYNEIE